MRVAAISDLHGYLPEIEECDLLLVAGDVCPDKQHHYQQRDWLRKDFSDWLEAQPAKDIVWIAGNHDFVCEVAGFKRIAAEMPGHYLQDESIELQGLKIYGLPWVPNLPSWAFYADDALLQLKYQAIPDDMDIIVSHGPPNGIGDLVYGDHVGAGPLYSYLHKNCPKLCVFGHIHEGYGRFEFPDMVLANVSYVDEFYDPVNKPQYFEI